ncbi:HlyD family type I secretion periplasmic adaptor subunit [Bacterioplanes sanyensis]|uniref:HlyD family type I secretion periplasmic adaptor subunit n=1 Tax=Bacterioplanes sanyensis TaxID=1249553 RepID=UPI001675A6DF|nr:HlyD family type I secretion periplasmic adaptor subunit [Bacterioplanes sanyensis]GGY55437.1 HlyD family type I secretion periplasmic adaptor subunit [Bacterioplanes sanyensis]
MSQRDPQQEKDTAMNDQGKNSESSVVVGEDGVVQGEYVREMPEVDVADELNIETDHKGRSKFGWWVVIATFVFFGGWAALAKLDGAAIGIGQVVTDSQNRVVQHLEGGVIAEVLVEDGDIVEQGDLLLRLSDTRARSELEIVESQLREIWGSEARLLAERAGSEAVSFPQELQEIADQPGVQAIIEGQRQVFAARRESYKSNIEIFQKRISALQKQIRGMTSMRDNLVGRIQSYEAEVEEWQDLYERQLADRIRLNEMRRELLRLQGERDSLESDIAKAEVEISSTRSEMTLKKEEYMEQVVTQLREAQQKKADLMARRISLADTLDRLDIRAPARGEVVGFKTRTIGAVIKPGDTIMEVVPNEQEFAIKARIQANDIDRVHAGLMADLRLSAFNFQAAHIIEAEVLRVSADAFTDEKTGEQYYEARLHVTEKGLATMKEQDMYFVPGMPAEVMIKTGERTVLHYLLGPVIRISEKAFREA